MHVTYIPLERPSRARTRHEAPVVASLLCLLSTAPLVLRVGHSHAACHGVHNDAEIFGPPISSLTSTMASVVDLILVALVLCLLLAFFTSGDDSNGQLSHQQHRRTSVDVGRAEYKSGSAARPAPQPPRRPSGPPRRSLEGQSVCCIADECPGR